MSSIIPFTYCSKWNHTNRRTLNPIATWNPRSPSYGDVFRFRVEHCEPTSVQHPKSRSPHTSNSVKTCALSPPTVPSSMIYILMCTCILISIYIDTYVCMQLYVFMYTIGAYILIFIYTLMYFCTLCIYIYVSPYLYAYVGMY